MIEQLKDEASLDSTNPARELNPGDQYRQLGDSAIAATLDSAARALRMREKSVAIMLACGQLLVTGLGSDRAHADACL